MQVSLSEEELKRVEIFKEVKLRKSISSSVRALIAYYFRKNDQGIQKKQTNGKSKEKMVNIIDEKKRKVIQCYLPNELFDKVDKFRQDHLYGSDSECARVIIIESLNSEGITI